MTTLFHLADRALNRPLLIHPDKALIVLDVIAGRIGLDAGHIEAPMPQASRFAGRVRRGGAYAVDGGTAIIPIVGSLVNRGAWIGANSGLVSYEGIGAQVSEAASDPSVHSVILDIDSGGGEAGGVKALADRISALAKTKRVVAVVNDVACSAAYWLAAAASEIIVSETSVVGSIGVVMLHVDRSAELERKGLAPTLIHAGAHKVDGNSMGPLPDDVRADLQSALDGLHGLFCRQVGDHRGSRLTAAAARATEARVFHGADAVRAGLADRLGTFADALRALRKPATGAKGARVAKVAARAEGLSAASAEAPTPIRRDLRINLLSEQAAKPTSEPAEVASAAWARAAARVNQRNSE